MLRDPQFPNPRFTGIFVGSTPAFPYGLMSPPNGECIDKPSTSRTRRVRCRPKAARYGTQVTIEAGYSAEGASLFRATGSGDLLD